MQPPSPTRPIFLGDDRTGRIQIGGGLPLDHPLSKGLTQATTPAPVSVQTMTAGYTHDIDKCVAEIHKLTAAGADIVRVAVPEKKDTEALPEILAQTTVPIVADVHFHFKRALESIEAGGHKIRLNPGNIKSAAVNQHRFCHEFALSAGGELLYKIDVRLHRLVR